MLEDKLLLWKFKHGSSESLERIYNKYETYLITVATALLNNTHAAEDVLHDFFVSFVTSADKIKLKGNLKAYLATCVANLARNRIKRILREYFRQNRHVITGRWDINIIAKKNTSGLSRDQAFLSLQNIFDSISRSCDH